MSAVETGATFRGWLFDGKGGARRLDDEEAARWTPDQGNLWVDLQSGHHADWLRARSGISEEHATLFFESGAWPRVSRPAPDCVLLVLRLPSRTHAKAKHPPKASVLRLWLEPHRVTSLTPAALVEIQEVRQRIESGAGPRDPSEFLLAVVETFTERLADVMLRVRAELAEIELELEPSQTDGVTRLRRLRRRALEWLRYAGPLRDLLIRLRTLDIPWLSLHHHRWQGVVDFCDEATRELESVGDHSRALHEYLDHRMSEQMNHRLYVLTLVSTILIPVSVVVDIFGANISTRWGNILGSEDPAWFLAYVLFILAFGWLVFVVIRRWLR